MENLLQEHNIYHYSLKWRYLGPNLCFSFPVALSVHLIFPYDLIIRSPALSLTFRNGLWKFGTETKFVHLFLSFTRITKRQVCTVPAIFLWCYGILIIFNSFTPVNNDIWFRHVSLSLLITWFTTRVRRLSKSIIHSGGRLRKLTDVILFSLFTPRMPCVTRHLEFLVLWRKYIISCTVDGSDFIILFPQRRIVFFLPRTSWKILDKATPNGPSAIPVLRQIFWINWFSKAIFIIVIDLWTIDVFDDFRRGTSSIRNISSYLW